MHAFLKKFPATFHLNDTVTIMTVFFHSRIFEVNVIQNNAGLLAVCNNEDPAAMEKCIAQHI